MLELKREQLERQTVKVRKRSFRKNLITQMRGEAGQFLMHAVFVCRLVFRDSRKA